MKSLSNKTLTLSNQSKSKASRTSNIWVTLYLCLLLSVHSSNAEFYVTWPNEVPIMSDESGTITLPKADVTLGFYGIYDDDDRNGIQPGDYVSVISNVQSCSSTMDMWNGALNGLGMKLLDDLSQTVLPLSIAPATLYTLCVCPAEYTQEIADTIVCRDQAGGESGLKVHRIAASSSHPAPCSAQTRAPATARQ
jgi:hypothetical protein